jgi:hypothetical protein
MKDQDAYSDGDGRIRLEKCRFDEMRFLGKEDQA